MWYFILMGCLFILALFYRAFDDTQYLVLGMFPAWVAYVLSIWAVAMVASMVFAFKTWRLPRDN